MEAKPYTRTLQDELDWKLIDQLSGVVSQISSFCFETKKFCVTTEFIVLAFVVKFTQSRLDHSVFVTALVIPTCFWFLDSTAYFYQVKIRGVMDSIISRLKSRDGTSLVEQGGARVISQERTAAPLYRRVLNAAINHSMWLYLLLVVVDAASWYLFGAGKIA